MTMIEAQTVIITQDDKPVIAVMPWELYEASMKALGILEILLDDILEDTDLMAALHQRSKTVEANKPILTEPWEDLLREEYLD